MDNTQSRYKAATKTLSRTEGELKELQEEERLQKEAEEIQGSGTKVNYETGEVTLSTGQTLSQAEAAKRVGTQSHCWLMEGGQRLLTHSHVGRLRPRLAPVPRLPTARARSQLCETQR